MINLDNITAVGFNTVEGHYAVVENGRGAERVSITQADYYRIRIGMELDDPIMCEFCNRIEVDYEAVCSGCQRSVCENCAIDGVCGDCYKPTPKADCPVCFGGGVVDDYVPYGSTWVPMPVACECVE